MNIKTDRGIYGAVIEIFKKNNPLISTAFASTEKGLETWFEKDNKRFAKTTAPNLQSGSSATKSNNVILGQTLNNIITNISPNFKSKQYNSPENTNNLNKKSNLTNLDKIIDIDFNIGYNIISR